MNFREGGPKSSPRTKAREVNPRSGPSPKFDEG